ncbi:MAG: nascent polypeptide-associated complex protein [Candidatus Pacearchaeota archaeon]
MFGDIKKMMGMMKQLGINQQEIPAERVIIEGKDSRIVIENPSVSKIKFQGQETWQIIGESREEAKEQGISEEDIRTVMEKTGKSKKQAKEALEKAKGDLAEAILSLS